MSVMRANKIPILTYHSIDESGSVISTKTEIFRKQIKFLSEAGYNAISLKTLEKYFCGQVELPPKTVSLTFDDGFQNFYSTAFPILNEFNFTATVFLIAGYCGKYNDWAGNLPIAEHSKLMDWSEIKELAQNGIEFAAHSLTHPDLTRTSTEAARREISESKRIIEDRLESEIVAFAYPYGAFNSSVKRLTQEYFAVACSTNLGKAKRGDDVYALKRLDAYYLSNERVFRSVLTDNFDWYIRFRQAMRGVKNRVLQ